MKSWIGVVVIVMLLAVAGAYLSQPKDQLDQYIQSHTNLALHIHQNLSIIIKGEPYTIPANIGITEKGMRVLHTHDNTGRIHVEGTEPHQFYLKDFFTVWGRNFNQTCIFKYCNDEDDVLSMYVNGVPSTLFGDLALQDEDVIELRYAKRDATP